MGKEPPFDAWDGEDLQTTEVVEEDAAEAVAMHVEVDAGERHAGHWSELTDHAKDEAPDDRPVSYFDDEQPEDDRRAGGDGEDDRADDRGDEAPEPDLEELLERQHYAFPQRD
jgi:hypothetical protein